MAKAIKVGGKARYNKTWLQSTCSYLDTDGTNGWAEVVSLDKFQGVREGCPACAGRTVLSGMVITPNGRRAVSDSIIL